MNSVLDGKERDFRLMARLYGIDAVIKSLRDEASQVGELYRDGIITYDEAQKRLYRPDAVRGAMAGVGWSFFPSRESARERVPTGSFEALEDDYYDWGWGPIKEVPERIPWLFKMGPARNCWDGFWLQTWCTGVASPDEKGQFFKLMEAAFTSVREFASPPSEMPVPWAHYVKEDGGLSGCICCNMDIALLMRAENPVGMRADLPLADGGVAHFEVTSVEMQQPYLPSRNPSPAWLSWKAMGWIEGYTRPIERPLDFESYYADVNVIHVGLPPDDDGWGDVALFRSHPLWGPYREWAEEYNCSAGRAGGSIESFLKVDPRRWHSNV